MRSLRGNRGEHAGLTRESGDERCVAQADAAAGLSCPDAADGPPCPVTRARWLGRSAAAAIALSATGAAALAAVRPRSSLTTRDRRALGFLLTLERLQDSFYAEALGSGRLTGEARQFAEVVGGEEHAHERYLTELLGGGGGAVPRYRFAQALGSGADFAAAAVTIEEAVLGAYNGQAENLSRATLAKVARVMSVESRHAAWARGLAGKLPAPVAADAATDARTAMNALRGFIAS